MIQIILILAGGVILLGLLSWWLIRSLAGAKKEIEKLETAVASRDHALKRMEEVFDDAEKKKASLHGGAPSDNFNASLGALGVPNDGTGKTNRPSFLAPVPESEGLGRDDGGGKPVPPRG